MTKKWVEVNDLSSGQYQSNKNIRFKSLMLRSDLRDYSNAYIVVKKEQVLQVLMMLTVEIKS